MSKSTRHLPAKTSIYLVMEYYRKHGANSERVNRIYKKIINKDGKPRYSETL